MKRTLVIAGLVLSSTAAQANGDYPIGYTPRRDFELAEKMKDAGLDIHDPKFGVLAGISMQSNPGDVGFGGGLDWYASKYFQVQLHLDVGTTLIHSDWLGAMRFFFTGGKRLTGMIGFEGFVGNGTIQGMGGGAQLSAGFGLATKVFRIGFIATVGYIDDGSGNGMESRGYVQLHVPITKSYAVNADYLLTNIDTDDNMGETSPVISVGVRKTL